MEGYNAFRVHFFDHDWMQGPPPLQVVNSCHWCQLRVFPSAQQYPVTIVNKTGDGAELPRDFRFITQSVLMSGVEAAGDSFRSGCACSSGEDCKYDGCECLSDMDSEDEQSSGDDSEHEKSAGSHRQPPRKRPKLAYYSSGPRAGLLRSRYLDSRAPIYECHDGCSCSRETCPNRVVERGRKIPLQIFRTEDRGWGVRTLVDIDKGQFVDRYLGEVITAAEANRRRDAVTLARQKDVYLFALDKFSDPDSLDQRLAGPPLEVDGEFLSGPTRFVNHSCNPNLRIFARVGDHADKHIHDLALFAVRDIPAGSEITFDYIDGLEALETDARDPARQDDMTPCLCQSANCRGYLW